MISQQLSLFQLLHYRKKQNKEINNLLKPNSKPTFNFSLFSHLRVSHYSTVLPHIILADAS